MQLCGGHGGLCPPQLACGHRLQLPAPRLRRPLSPGPDRAPTGERKDITAATRGGSPV